MRSVQAWLREHTDELIDLRRDLHAHPELSRQEVRTTRLLVERLRRAGLDPLVLEGGTGLVCDIGPIGAGPTVALRADLDALPLQDTKDAPYRSTVDGVCHACGHDVHTAVVLGAGLALAAREDVLPGRVRLIFQPAEELLPGGAVDVIAQGHAKGLSMVFSVHCDPALEVGRVGLRAGPLTAATDAVEVRLSGPGGHTARPHKTVDLVNALAAVATDVPALLSRTVDPRAGLCLVWGHISAGVARNAIPRLGVLRGTLRVLDRDVWTQTPELVQRAVHAVAASYGATAELSYERGVPPVVNDPQATAILTAAVDATLGPGMAVPVPQSLGGEDFSWYLEHVAGAMARLGVRPPGLVEAPDLHHSAFDVDESAIAVGVQVLAAATLDALRRP